MSGFIQLQTTVAGSEEAEALARQLLEQRLVACVQIVGPMTSLYWWQGAIDHSREYLCVMKTRAGLFDRVVAEISNRHQYETPEIIATPIVAGSTGYLAWLAAELADG